MNIQKLVKIEAKVYQLRRIDNTEAAEDLEAQIPAEMFSHCHKVQKLIESGRTSIFVNMGSCQCGHLRAVVKMQPDGKLYAVSVGNYDWMNYRGPADKCDVAYGLGERVKALHRAYQAYTEQ